MSKTLRRLLGVMGIGVSWATVWAAFFTALVLIVGIVRPGDVDAGEGPSVASRIGSIMGLVSGAVFGLILSFAARRKSLLELTLTRVAIWGIVASAVWPLLTAVDNGMILILGPLGAICASASVAIARGAELDQSQRPRLLTWLRRLVAKPLQAVCGPNG